MHLARRASCGGTGAGFAGPVLFIIGRVAAIAMGRNEHHDATDSGAISVVA